MMPPDAAPKVSVLRTYRYRIYPTRAQIETLEVQLGFACDLYNAGLQELRSRHERAVTHGEREPETGKLRTVREWRVWDADRQVWRWTEEPPPGPGFKEQSAAITQFRQEGGAYPDGMSALVMRDPLRRLHKSYKAFFDGLKQGRRVGPPRYRPKQRYDSLTFQLTAGSTTGAGTYRKGALRLTGVGELRLERHRAMPENAIARTATVLRSCGRWYVAISAEMPAASPSLDDRPPVGLDMGVIQWCTAFTPDPAAAERLVADLQRMATDPVDLRRLWAAERHTRRLGAALAHYAALGVRPPYGCGARRARLARMARRRHARVLFRLRQIEARVAKLRKKLAAASAVAEVVSDEAGAAVLIEGSHAGPRHARRVARAQRRLARRTRRGHSHSHRRKKAVGPYARAKERERSLRADHRHKASRALVRQFGLICVEDLEVRKLTAAPKQAPESELPADIKRRLNNRILDQAWYQFFQVTAYKAVDAGGSLAKKLAVNSTQECARCGRLVPKLMTLRVHRCPACGYVAPRTVNSARNVLQRPLEQPGRAGPSGANGGGSPRAVA